MTDPAASVIPALLVLAAILLWWHSTVRALDRARDAARALCRRRGWQLLDQTVSLRAVRPRRGDKGLCLERSYRFEFSADGETRQPGGVLMAGGRILRVWADGPEGRVIEEA
ncbi:MAG: DUF3301 domain-containing protein, partial [Wenzhouxiangellaceae bacterium]|nr:DUF3301 domain-containing protein [Wenzhouxiangellaceae bacterium]